MLRTLCQRTLINKTSKPKITKSINIRSFAKSSAMRQQQAKSQSHQHFDPSWLDYLACPLTKKPLKYDEKNNELISEVVGVAYPIRDGIPVLVPSEARKLT
jgi:uncharacterized protein YbaR (Trm112 family)